MKIAVARKKRPLFPGKKKKNRERRIEEGAYYFPPHYNKERT
jgi:hypothetical protein